MTPTTIGDLPSTLKAPPTVTVYGPHVCPNCKKATDLFDRRGVQYTKVDLEPGDANHVYVKEQLGYEAAPVIVVKLPSGREIHWGGHRIDMLTALVHLCTQGIEPDEGEAHV